MLRAALDQFGRHGFDGTTTRMIASAAGMNLGAIPYYFGTKDELYVEAAAFLADAIEARQRGPLLRLQALRPLPTGALSADVPLPTTHDLLIDQVVAFLCQQARVLLADDFPAEWVQFFLRVQAEEGPAFDRLFTRVVAPMQDAVEGLVARICGRDATDALPRTLTFLAAHQVMSFRLSDALLMRRLGWDRLTPERTDQLLDLIAITLRAQLAAMAAPAP
jgi:AcrR family transcriptional regulator